MAKQIPIAVCGYGYRLPGGLDDDDDAFWKLMTERGFVQEPAGDRYGYTEMPYDERAAPNNPYRIASLYEGLMRNGRELEFDCTLFGIAKPEAMRMDPQIKLLLTVTWEALQHAGMDMNALNNSNTGVFIGHQVGSAAMWKPPLGAMTMDVAGRSAALLANRISYHFNWRGPSFSVASACSSGVTALDAAIQKLQMAAYPNEDNGDGGCNVAVFGAVLYLGDVHASVAFNNLGVISRTGSCRSFDENANGYMRSEGVFSFILKRLPDAERDGDAIWGVIRGCGINTAGSQEGADVLTPGRMIVAPVERAQRMLMEQVARAAGIHPHQVSYVEAHATGTVVGDTVEGNAILAAYGGTDRPTPLRVASVKTNLGHLEAASFTASFLKVLLMLKHRIFIPQSMHYQTPNPNIPFSQHNVVVQTTCEPFPQDGDDDDNPVIIGINSFGFGGANGHCLVEEYRGPNRRSDVWSRLPGMMVTNGYTESRNACNGNVNGQHAKVFMVPLSAKSDEALMTYAGRLACRLESIVQAQQEEKQKQTQGQHQQQDNNNKKLYKDVDLYTVVANLSVRMTHHRHRAALMASTMTELCQQLHTLTSSSPGNGKRNNNIVTVQQASTPRRPDGTGGIQPATVLLVFPGQGSQWPGCGGRALYDTEVVFRRVVDAIDAQWMELTGNDQEKLSTVAFDPNIGETLYECQWAQPVTFLLQVALFELLQAYGVYPTAVMGHSAGEVAAAYASGAYTLEEACALVYHRSRLQQGLRGSGRMLVLEQDRTSVQQLLESFGYQVKIHLSDIPANAQEPLPCEENEDVENVIEIACINSPNSTVVCASCTTIFRLQDRLQSEGLPGGKLIPGNIAFHSHYMNKIQNQLLQALQPLHKSEPKKALVPFISTVSGDFMTEEFHQVYWWENVRCPVQFMDAMTTAMLHVRPSAIIEISPHITLRSAIREVYMAADGILPAYIHTMTKDADNAAKCFFRCIGDCYKAGELLNFRTLYPRPRPITHLFPPYAMKRERIIDTNLSEAPLLTEPLFSAGPLLGILHPASDNIRRYRVAMSRKHYPILAEHFVQDSTIVPGATYMEMIFEALFKGNPIHVVDANFLVPIIVSDTAVLLYLEMEKMLHAPNKYEFTVFSRRPETKPEDSTIHCRGIVQEITTEQLDLLIPPEVPMNLCGLKDDDFSTPINTDGETFYETQEARNPDFRYGPNFRTVQNIKADTSRDLMRIRAEIGVSEDIWEKWTKMGYLFHPCVLDGALQIFLVQATEAIDYTGIPRRMDGLVFIRPPRSGKLICICEPSGYVSGWFHEKGQIAVNLGEQSAGRIYCYDSADGSLVAFLRNYTTTMTNKNKAEAYRVKHFLSWQPKTSCGSDALGKIADVSSFLGQRSSTGEIVKDLIRAFTTSHPQTGIPFFVNVGEAFLGAPCSSLFLSDCLHILHNAPVQYTVVSSSIQFLKEQYKTFGVGNKDANLRFVLSDELDQDKAFLRYGMFELLILRIPREDAKELLGNVTELVSLATPGGLLLVESWLEPADILPWPCIWHLASTEDQPATTLYQTPVWDGNPYKDATVARPLIVPDTMGFADHWTKYIHESSTMADTDLSQLNEYSVIYYFAMEDADYNISSLELHDAAARLTLWVKKFAENRIDSSKKIQSSCLLNVLTSGAVHDVTSPSQTAVWGAVRSMAIELGDVCKIDFRLIDVGTVQDLNHVNGLYHFRERELCVRNGRIWTSRLINVRESSPKADLTVDQSPYHLHTTNSGMISDLEFRTHELKPLAPYEIEISVQASALNFRDIMVALGRLPIMAYERSALGRTVGLECSGTIVQIGSLVQQHKVGDRVMALYGGCIANRITCHEAIARRLPDNISFEEGASVGAVYVTAYYALITVSNLREEQKILIHSGMGGVGQAAIELAKWRKAQVYATAGSEDKRESLRAMGCIGVFDSHSTDWFRGLMLATHGQGVDVVLNSLAGEHIDLCLESLSPGGIHCEIGKVDIFQNRSLNMAVFRKNLRFAAIDIDRMMLDAPVLVKEMIETVLQLLHRREVKPVTITTFDYVDYQDALTLMMSGKHIGKLVLKCPQGSQTLRVVDQRPIFRSNRTVLISGGFGGFGLRLFSFLVSMGAKKLLFLDRDVQRKRTLHWLLKKSGLGKLKEDIRVEIVHADVGVYSQVIAAVNAVITLDMPPIGWVFHLAGELDDRRFQDMDRPSFAKVFASKAQGAWNLHRALFDCDTLENFVMFSSTSSVLGNPGQINYSAANAFQDGLASLRQRLGKPALSFCLGAVAETGMASRNNRLLMMMRASGMPPISVSFSIEALDYALRQGTSGNAVACLATSFPADTESTDFLRTGAQLVRNSAAFKLGSTGVLSKQTLIELLTTKVAAICGIDKVHPSETFSSYGLTSISVAEFGAYLKQEMSYAVSAMELMSSATCESLAQSIIDSQTKEKKSKQSLLLPDKIEEETRPSRWSDNLKQIRRISRFSPSFQEHFNFPLNLKMKNTHKQRNRVGENELESSKSHLNQNSPGTDVFQWRLPHVCQRTFDDLTNFIDTFEATSLAHAKPIAEVKTVLLTGVTGFFGRHFVVELLEKNTIDKIYCPVRASSDEEAFDRVVGALQEVGLWSESYRTRLFIFRADLEKDDFFSWSLEQYNELAETIDAVYHFAADVTLAAPFEIMRKRNCAMLRPILRLCLTKRRKHLFHASTLGIFPQYVCMFRNEMADKQIDRDAMPDVADMNRMFPLPVAGYMWSKFVSELVLLHAHHKKQIPLALFRLPLMFGHSKTGFPVLGQLRIIYAMLKTRSTVGYERQLNLEDGELAVQIVLDVSLNPHRRNVVYNCTRYSHKMFTECPPLAMMGFRCVQVTYEAFKAKCQELNEKDPLRGLWAGMDNGMEYWYKPWQSNNEFPIDITALREDCRRLPQQTDGRRLFLSVIEWAMRNSVRCGYDKEVFDVRLETSILTEPIRDLCLKYNINFKDCIPRNVLEALDHLCNDILVRDEKRLKVAATLTSRLETRVRLFRLLQLQPEILQEPITSPVFIIGLNRTGTTFLQRSLVASGFFDSPHIEEQVSVPPPELCISWGEKEYKDWHDAIDDMLKNDIENMRGIHEIGQAIPEEDFCAHMHSFKTIGYYFDYDASHYNEWLDQQSMIDVYQEHRQWIQYITWSRRRAGSLVKRWCLKMPWHSRSLGALLSVYPDAVFVQTHRDPKEVIGSLCSFTERLQTFNGVNVQRKTLGRKQVCIMSSTLEAILKFRQEHPEVNDRWLDVVFEEMIRSPIETIASVIHHTGLVAEESTMKKLLTYVDESQNKHRSTKLHEYNISNYFIDQAELTKGIFEKYERLRSSLTEG